MKISRPVFASAALGTTLLLGGCFGGQAMEPTPPAVTTAPGAGANTGAPSQQPAASTIDPQTTPPAAVPPPAPETAAPPVVAPPPPVAPPVPAPPAPPPAAVQPAPAAPRVAPAAPRVAPPAPAAPRVVPPAPRPPMGNDHDADNNGGPDDGDGNR